MSDLREKLRDCTATWTLPKLRGEELGFLIDLLHERREKARHDPSVRLYADEERLLEQSLCRLETEAFFVATANRETT